MIAKTMIAERLLLALRTQVKEYILIYFQDYLQGLQLNLLQEQD